MHRRLCLFYNYYSLPQIWRVQSASVELQINQYIYIYIHKMYTQRKKLSKPMFFLNDK